MKSNDKDLFEYLHDALVSNIVFDCAEGPKKIILNTIFDEDCGNIDWNGRSAVITFSDIILSTALLLGHTSAQETIESFRQGVSETTRQRIEDMVTAGISAPQVFITIVFQSGSEIEVACAEANIAAP